MFKKILIFNLLALSACGGQEPAKNGQIIAKVGSEEISYHQLNFILSRIPGVTQENLLSVKKNAVNSLVDQSLLYQEAINDKLDIDPKVMLSIEQAKREILAEAWMQKTANSFAKPNAEEVDQYYDAHPDLFAKHKIFKLKELIIKDSENKREEINAILTGKKQVDELIKALQEATISFQVKETVQGAESLPLDQLNKIAVLGEGEFISIKNDTALWVISVLAKTEEKIDKNKAQPLIEAFLSNQRKKSLAEAALKKLKDKAKIEYMGEFSELMINQSPEAITPVVEQPPIEGHEKSNVINSGVKGL